MTCRFLLHALLFTMTSIVQSAGNNSPVGAAAFVSTPYSDYPMTVANERWLLQLPDTVPAVVRLRHVDKPRAVTLLATGEALPFDYDAGDLTIGLAGLPAPLAGEVLQLRYRPNRWRERMGIFMESDAAAAPAKAWGVLLTGSSTAAGWRVDAWFADSNVLNRGFGGSQFVDLFCFAGEIMGNHAPHTIVLYSGDNDIQDGKPPDRVFADCVAAVARFHGIAPQSRIILLAIKPSPSRWDKYPAMQEANALMERYAATREHVEFLDLGKLLLDADGVPDPVCYQPDALHLSEEGYRRWSETLRPLLQGE